MKVSNTTNRRKDRGNVRAEGMRTRTIIASVCSFALYELASGKGLSRFTLKGGDSGTIGKKIKIKIKMC